MAAIVHCSVSYIHNNISYFQIHIIGTMGKKKINQKEVFWRSISKGIGYTSLGLGVPTANPFAIGVGLGALGIGYYKRKRRQ